MKKIIFVLVVLFFLMTPVLAAPYCKIDNYDGKHIITGEKTGYVDKSITKEGPGYAYLWMQEKILQIKVLTNVEATVTAGGKTCTSKKPRIGILVCPWCKYECKFELQAGDYKVTASAEHYGTATKNIALTRDTSVKLFLDGETSTLSGHVFAFVSNMKGVLVETYGLDFFSSLTKTKKTTSGNDGKYSLSMKQTDYEKGVGVQAALSYHPDLNANSAPAFVIADYEKSWCVSKLCAQKTPLKKQKWYSELTEPTYKQSYFFSDSNGGFGYYWFQRAYDHFDRLGVRKSFTVYYNIPHDLCDSNAVKDTSCSNNLINTILVNKRQTRYESMLPHEYAHIISPGNMVWGHDVPVPTEESWADFASGWVRNKADYGGRNFKTSKINIVADRTSDYSSREWALAGVYWDINEKHPGEIYKTFRSYKGKLDTLHKVYHALKNNPNIDDSFVCEAFKNHGFVYDNVNLAPEIMPNVTKWDSGCK